MVSTGVKRLSRLARPDPYSINELSKHIDPILLKDLGRLTLANFKSKHLTVVFWDITGFSKMCNELIEFQDSITYFLDDYFAAGLRIMNKYHGVLDKFIGDGILAYFGYNKRYGTGEPHRALDAAIEFKNDFPKLKENFVNFCNNRNGIEISDISLRCGMNNGPVYFHHFGSPTRNSIILLGKTVNLASRLEEIAEKDEIIISERLKNMVGEDFRYRKIDLKDRIKNSKLKDFEQEKYIYEILERNQ